VWAGLYQQRPTLSEGGLIKREWLTHWDTLPEKFDDVIQSWDLSVKGGEDNDFVAGHVWGRKDEKKYLIDFFHGKRGFTDTVPEIVKMRRKFPNAPIYIEDKANGPPVIETLKREFQFDGVIPINPTSSKHLRMVGHSHQIRAGDIMLPPMDIDGVEYIREEMVNFGNWPNDDHIDAMTQALDQFREPELIFF
jgi:predicted phage terminase large subunit-like protein